MGEELPPLLKQTAEKVAEGDYMYKIGYLRGKVANRPEFAFMNETDPLYGHFMAMVMRIRNPVEEAKEEPVVEATAKAVRSLEWVTPHPVMTKRQRMRLHYTAQNVAVNGQSFLDFLCSRHDPDHAFLQPTDTLNPHFVALVRQYAKLLGTTPFTDTLGLSETAEQTVSAQRCVFLEKCQARADADSIVRARDAAAREYQARKADMEVDWADIVVVDTLAFPPEEIPALPLAMDTPAVRDVGVLPTLRGDIDMKSREEAAAAEQAQTRAEAEKNQRLRARLPAGMSGAVVRGAMGSTARASTATIECPVCGRMVRADGFSDHIRHEVANHTRDAELKKMLGEKRFAQAQQGQIDVNAVVADILAARPELGSGVAPAPVAVVRPALGVSLADSQLESKRAPDDIPAPGSGTVVEVTFLEKDVPPAVLGEPAWDRIKGSTQALKFTGPVTVGSVIGRVAAEFNIPENVLKNRFRNKADDKFLKGEDEELSNGMRLELVFKAPRRRGKR
ncbi:Pre-mRNA splicing factor PRP21-like protein [Carpediemonas membranifera]|uniref:Pre-mRNA splicing factor PRP21-like protein n=1 Tax=Carpediemonas membranifera TaxID=201153 RepID=A0A8J6APU3_9EUKA|nr:Pre-mRNA splicing factor PRP21-like protein [Carpediemonas membranifera]|eukprot:KAG9390481.1 Pre-mRNA splicing factor PRP21-like protein [Carpediemonas membranifera]